MISFCGIKPPKMAFISGLDMMISYPKQARIINIKPPTMLSIHLKPFA